MIDFDISNINLPVFEYPLHILVNACLQRLESLNISVSVSRTSLQGFLNECLQMCNFVAFHNFSHCVSVFQTFNLLIGTSELLQQMLGRDDLFLGLIAALSHDLGHRKFNKRVKITTSK